MISLINTPCSLKLRIIIRAPFFFKRLISILLVEIWLKKDKVPNNSIDLIARIRMKMFYGNLPYHPCS